MPKTTQKKAPSAKRKVSDKKISKKDEKEIKKVKKTKKIEKTEKIKDSKVAKEEKGKRESAGETKEEGKYYEAVGRRKTSAARVRLWTKGKSELLINGKPFDRYFFTMPLRKTARAALDKLNCLDKFRISVVVSGGGVASQAEAVRHGTARALEKFNPEFRKELKKLGYLTRDDRRRERKKPGLKRARRAPQWSKR